MNEVKSLNGLIRKFSSNRWRNGLCCIQPPNVKNWNAFKNISHHTMISQTAYSTKCLQYHVFIESITLSYEYKIPLLLARYDSHINDWEFSTIKYTADYCMVRHKSRRMVYNKFEKNQLKLYEVMSSI